MTTFVRIIVYLILFVLINIFLIFQNNASGRVNPTVGSGVQDTCSQRLKSYCIDDLTEEEIKAIK